MREISLEELKKIELSLLQSIDKICKEEKLRYSLGYGTLLGAVRHKGFIPWDDDIDIVMPRPDYNKLISYCKRNRVSFDLISIETADWYGYPFAKVCARETVIQEKETDFDNKMGIYVDIFPIDGAGNSISHAKKIYLTTKFFKYLVFAAHWKTYFRSKTHKIYYEPIRILFFLISRGIRPESIIRKIDKKYARYSFDDSMYAESVYSPYGVRDIMKTEIFKQYIDIEFEGVTVKAFKNYSQYLSSLYGDYMSLPPLDKRVSHHLFKAYYKERS